MQPLTETGTHLRHGPPYTSRVDCPGSTSATSRSRLTEAAAAGPSSVPPLPRSATATRPLDDPRHALLAQRPLQQLHDYPPRIRALPRQTCPPTTSTLPMRTSTSGTNPSASAADSGVTTVVFSTPTSIPEAGVPPPRPAPGQRRHPRRCPPTLCRPRARRRGAQQRPAPARGVSRTQRRDTAALAVGAERPWAALTSRVRGAPRRTPPRPSLCDGHRKQGYCIRSRQLSRLSATSRSRLTASDSAHPPARSSSSKTRQYSGVLAASKGLQHRPPWPSSKLWARPSTTCSTSA